MEWFIIILILLVVIAVSNVLHHFVPMLPVPLIQIILGSILAVIPLGIHIIFEPELFFVLFVAPILFNDGKMIPKSELWKLRIPVLLLALGLVFATVLTGGYLIRWLIAGIPLPAAFALAAILSPTDAVAVNALSKKAHINRNILTLLEGEALMNDASGLVAFKFAVAATVSGVFSIKAAALSFLAVAFGGLAIGVISALIIIKSRIFLRKLGMEDVTLHMLIQILTPFIIFLTAEHSGASGILAVVAGGLVHSIEKSHVESTTLELQIMSENTWSVIMFILNGLVFVLLGLQLPAVMRVVYYNQDISKIISFSNIALLTVALIVLRYIWVYLCWKPAYVWGKGAKKNLPGPRSFLLISISGVRGAVTLAAALSIPRTLQNGEAFPQRDYIIFLAAGVILMSLIIASIFIPLISGKAASKGKKHIIDHERSARVKLLRAVIKAMKEEADPEKQAAALSVITDCKKVISQLVHEKAGTRRDYRSNTDETQLWLIALNAEKREIACMLREGRITRAMSCRLLESVKRREMLLDYKYRHLLLLYVYFLKRVLIGLRHRRAGFRLPAAQYRDAGRDIRGRMSEAAVEAVKNQITDENSELSHAVISRYKAANELTDRGEESFLAENKSIKHKKELQLKAIQIERNKVQSLFENGDITRGTADRLRRYINFTEAGIVQEDVLTEILF